MGVVWSRVGLKRRFGNEISRFCSRTVLIATFILVVFQLFPLINPVNDTYAGPATRMLHDGSAKFDTCSDITQRSLYTCSVAFCCDDDVLRSYPRAVVEFHMAVSFILVAVTGMPTFNIYRTNVKSMIAVICSAGAPMTGDRWQFLPPEKIRQQKM